VSVFPDNIKLQGGLNLVEPALSTPKGEVIAAFNYEADQEGGYAWVQGYVPFDGASAVLDNGDFYTDDDWVFGTGWVHDAENQELVGTAATGDSAKAIAIIVGQTYRCRTIIRNYDSGSVLIQSGTKNASYNADGEFEFEFIADAATDIEIIPTNFTGIIESVHIMPIVPGNGDILGACIYLGNTYAFRNNSGDTAAIMHVSSTIGWTAVDLGSHIKFQNGKVVFTVGDTLTGFSSGATGVIEDFHVISGSWASNDAAGYIALSGVTGSPFTDLEKITDTSGGDADADGIDVTNTLSPGGRYEFVIDNLFGSTDGKSLFFVNGVGEAYHHENGGTLPLEHGIDANPTHIGQYQNHLMLGFDEGLFAFSETGKPLGWDAGLTAGQYPTGSKFNGFKTLPQALLVICESHTYILYGTSKSNFDLTEFEDQGGGVKFSSQTISGTYFINHSGLVDFRAVQDYGNFSDAAISKKVRPYITTRVADVICSAVHHGKTQYRVFFNDTTALYATFAGRKLIGFMPITLKDQPSCMYNGRDSGNLEYTVMGSADGKVFKMDTGNLFNGHKIQAKLKLAYNHMGRPAQKKRVRKGDLYVTSSVGAKLKVRVDYNYGSINRSSMNAVDVEQITGEAALWDVSKWDEFLWDSSGDPRLEIPLDGSGIAVAMTIFNAGMIQGNHRIDSLVYHYSNRGRNR